jgi:hypothetical protein
MQKLPLRDRLLLTLFYFVGQSYEGIYHSLNLPLLVEQSKKKVDLTEAVA